MSRTLVNFMIDDDDLGRFDSITAMLNRTRTSVLTEMIKRFCSEQIIAVENRNRQLEQLNLALTQQHVLQVQADEACRINRPLWRVDAENDLPSPFMSDGHEEF